MVSQMTWKRQTLAAPAPAVPRVQAGADDQQQVVCMESRSLAVPGGQEAFRVGIPWEVGGEGTEGFREG